ELVVLRTRHGDVHRVVGGDVEEERASRLDDRRPPGRTTAPTVSAPFVPAEPALESSTSGEQDRSDEEGDPVGRAADELGVTGKRAAEKTGQTESEDGHHPPSTCHQAFFPRRASTRNGARRGAAPPPPRRRRPAPASARAASGRSRSRESCPALDVSRSHS